MSYNKNGITGNWYSGIPPQGVMNLEECRASIQIPCVPTQHRPMLPEDIGCIAQGGYIAVPSAEYLDFINLLKYRDTPRHQEYLTCYNRVVDGQCG